MCKLKITNEQLKAFIVVYEEHSFSRAAKKLNKHRTTVAQIINYLEDILTLKLFDRSGRKTLPTKEANELYFYAKQSVESCKSFEHLARSLQLNELKKISIGYSALLPKIVIYNLRSSLNNSYPDLNVNFERLEKKVTKTLLEEDEIQFAIVEVDERDATDGLERTFLTHINFFVMASQYHPITNYKPEIRLNTLKNMRQLVFKEHLEAKVHRKLQLSSQYEVLNDFELLLTLVDKGLGWAVLPKTVSYLQKEFNNIRTLNVSHLKDDIRIPLALWNKYDHRLTLIRSIILDSLMNSREEIYAMKQTTALEKI